MSKIIFTILVCISFITCNSSEDAILATVSNMLPTRGPKNTEVTITGSNFGTDINQVHVFFNGKEAEIKSVSETIIVAIVPPKAFTGNVTVVVRGQETEGLYFNYEISDVQVSTLAGSTVGYTDGTGTSARFYNPSGITVDSQGNLYVADTYNHRIRKITPEGVVSTLAGSSILGNTDGAGANARFYYPRDITVDSQDNLYVADTNNHRIRKITPEGVVSTLAGSTLGNTDGTGTSARFHYPYGIATDSQDNVYVADTYNHRIRKVTPEGVVSTLAGSTLGNTDGTGTGAQFNYPYGIATDSQDNVYVADTYNYRVRKVTSGGVVSTLTGYIDGVDINTQVYQPSDIVIDAQGNLYMADIYNHRIHKITPEGIASTLAGSSVGSTDGAGADARFYRPMGITVDTQNNLYVAEEYNHRIRKITQE
ncbi:MAG: IPT/TIG domain-containing protein [Flavobacteriales bacterium]